MKLIKVFCTLILISAFTIQVHASKIQWAKFLKDTTRVKSPRTYRIQGSCVDKYNNIYFCYYINSFDTSISFVTKLSPDGKIIWNKSLFPFEKNNRIYNRFELKYQMHIDGNQNIIIAGALWDTIGNSINNCYSRNLFFMKWNIDGNEIAQKLIPIYNPNHTASAYLSDFKVQPNGDIYLCDYFNDTGFYPCTIYGVNKNFDSIFSYKLNMKGINSLNDPRRPPIMGINDNSITLIYTMEKSVTENMHFMMQLSLANADTNWIRFKTEIGDAYIGAQIEIYKNNIYVIGDGIEKYSITGDPIYTYRKKHINRILIDTTSTIIYGIALQAQNDINIYMYDTNLNLLNTITPTYNSGKDKRLLSIFLKDSIITTYGYTRDINNYSKFYSLDINQMTTDGNFYHQERVELDSNVITSISVENPIIDNNQDVVLITTLTFRVILDSLNNRYFSIPIFGCKFSFNTLMNVTGTVYLDENKNCLLDNNELGLENNLIHMLPEDNYTFTDSIGKYYFSKNNGNSTIEFTTSINESINCISNGIYTVNTINGELIDSLDFGIKVSKINNDARCSLYVGPTRLEKIQKENLQIQNIGNSTLLNSNIIFTFDSSFSFQSASILPDSIINNTIYWSFDTLLIGKVKNIFVELLPANNLTMGYTYIHTLQINAKGDSVNISNNVDTVSGILINDYNQNHKTASPKGFGSEGLIENNTTLNYLIEFQNTGTDTVFQVTLIDELDSNLDISSLVIQGASHPMHYSLNNRILKLYFNNLVLLDSNIDFNNSTGYAAYSIKPKENIEGKKIKNSANIFFNYGEPVQTNTTLHTIEYKNKILDELKDDLIAYPIPLLENQLTIDINIVSSGKTKLEIYDISGRKIHTILNGNIEKGMYQYKLDHSIFNSNQLYLITLTTPHSKRSIKLLKN